MLQTCQFHIAGSTDTASDPIVHLCQGEARAVPRDTSLSTTRIGGASFRINEPPPLNAWRNVEGHGRGKRERVRTAYRSPRPRSSGRRVPWDSSTQRLAAR